MLLRAAPFSEHQQTDGDSAADTWSNKSEATCKRHMQHTVYIHSNKNMAPPAHVTTRKLACVCPVNAHMHMPLTHLNSTRQALQCHSVSFEPAAQLQGSQVQSASPLDCHNQPYGAVAQQHPKLSALKPLLATTYSGLLPAVGPAAAVAAGRCVALTNTHLGVYAYHVCVNHNQMCV